MVLIEIKCRLRTSASNVNKHRTNMMSAFGLKQAFCAEENSTNNNRCRPKVNVGVALVASSVFIKGGSHF